ncbi:MAG TPA: peptidylprolyl isomerase [Chloroflexota bacterium]|nr:peptidylprolyl isomerase [Chloroflexota bacterium]
MNAESPDIDRRRRKTPARRTPAIIEQRAKTPFFLRWGADLDRRQREALKERIALFSGIVLAVVIAGLLGWGWYQDNVARPAALAAQNNRIVAVVGNDTIRYGWFMKVAKFEKKQLNNDVTQLQQEQAQLQASPKKNAAQLAQISQQIQQYQAQLSSVGQDALTTLIEDDTMEQRAATAGVHLSKHEMSQVMTLMADRAGGIGYLNRYIAQSGLTYAQFEWLVRGDQLRTDLSKVLAKKVSHVQLKIRASHILIATKNHALAVRLYHEVLSGANFAALAKKYSTDKSSAVRGGDLGYADPSTYVPSFANALHQMSVGQVRLVKSQYGWHIIKETGREHVHLTAAQYQQAQQQAVATWLQGQELKLHIQRVMNVTSIPGLASSASPSLYNPGTTGATAPQSPASVQKVIKRLTKGTKKTGSVKK